MRIRSKNFYFHDQWIAVCAKLIGEVVAEERPLVKYRQHESNVVGSAKDSYLGLFRKLFAGEVLNKLAFSYFARRQLALDLTDRARHWQAAPIENLLEVDAVWFSFLGLFQFLRKKAFLSALDFRICTKILLGYVLFKIGYKYQDDNPIDQPDQRNIELD
jgi:hypothetical protein